MCDTFDENDLAIEWLAKGSLEAVEYKVGLYCFWENTINTFPFFGLVILFSACLPFTYIPLLLYLDRKVGTLLKMCF